jgi:hypothetical protein
MRHSAISLIVICTSLQTIMAVQADQIVDSKGRIFAQEVDQPMHTRIRRTNKTKAYSTARYLVMNHAIHQAARRPEYVR